MKKLKKMFCYFVLVMLMVISSAKSTYASSNYDKVIIDIAKKHDELTGFSNISSNPFVEGNRYFTVEEPEKEHFEVDVNGTKMTIIVSDASEGAYEPQNINELRSKEVLDIIESSKEKIEDYIEKSSILEEKESILSYISSLEIKEARFTDDSGVGAYFSADDSKIYVNKDNSAYICEWMICHEYIHAIAFYTHNEGSLDNIPYTYSLYNEVFTDLITSSLEPDINESVSSYYQNYYELIYPYIHMMGEDSIKAYFYGYDRIYESIDKLEFDFFVNVIENFGEENSPAYYNNLILKWYATISSK